MDEILAFKKLQRRQRDAAELLWQDGRLRAELTDEQADKLLTWGVDYATRQLNRTIDMPDGDAETFADELLSRLRRVLRRTARLAGMGQMGEKTAVLHTQLHSLSGEWQALTGNELDGGEQLLAQIQLFPAQTFDILMAAISLEQEEE